MLGKPASRLVLSAVILLTASVSVFGQKPRSPLSSQPNGAVARGHRDPCWEQAGISKEAIEQRRSVEQSAKTQIQAVCLDTSLTPQQKHEKIRSIHEQTQQQLQGLITPQQRETLKACQVSRRGGQTAPVPHGGGKGPCGEALPAPTP